MRLHSAKMKELQCYFEKRKFSFSSSNVSTQSMKRPHIYPVYLFILLINKVYSMSQ